MNSTSTIQCQRGAIPAPVMQPETVTSPQNAECEENKAKEHQNMDISNYSYTAPGFLDESPRAPIDQTFFDTRAAALDIAYKIPGYESASRETKNYIYDAIIRAMKGVKTA